jgi:hypothetical protein
MNRQFRGFSKSQYGWVYGNLVQINLDNKHYIIPNHQKLEGIMDWGVFEVEPDSVGQYAGYIPNTSMYVDNSCNVYEGDLIIEERDDLKQNRYFTTYKLMKNPYDSGFYGFGNRGDDYGPFTMRLSKDNLKKYVVVGNMFENPELFDVYDKYKK